MSSVTVRFYAQLNQFLPEPWRQTTLTHVFSGQPSVKNVIESLGVPHTEVDLILVDGIPADFSHQVQDRERVAVYPAFMRLDLAGDTKVRPHPLEECRFVLDNHLGKLTRLLRLVGFDADYPRDAADPELAERSSAQDRILLTRDRALLKRKKVVHGYYVWSTHPESQLIEVLQRFRLWDQLHPFSRCLICNEPLEMIPASEARARIPAKVSESFSEFTTCPVCGRIFWKGDHYTKMNAFISTLQMPGHKTNGLHRKDHHAKN